MHCWDYWNVLWTPVERGAYIRWNGKTKKKYRDIFSNNSSEKKLFNLNDYGSIWMGRSSHHANSFIYWWRIMENILIIQEFLFVDFRKNMDAVWYLSFFRTGIILLNIILPQEELKFLKDVSSVNLISGKRGKTNFLWEESLVSLLLQSKKWFSFWKVWVSLLVHY